MSGNENETPPGKRSNPWGNPNAGNQSPVQGPWSGGRGGNNGGTPQRGGDMPDIDAALRELHARLGGNGGGRIIGMILLAILGVWLLSGIYRIDPAENGVIKRFGEHVRTQTQPGLGYHLPWPIENLTKVNITAERRVQIGFNDAPGGARRDIPAESLMLTSDANIVDIDVVILWNIDNAENYLFNVRNVDQAIKQVAESAIRTEVGQARLQSIITEGRNDVAASIQKNMQSILDSYKSGVAIKQVLILEATVHPDVLEAYNDVAASRQDAERFQNEAMIYRNDILPKARGEAIRMEQAAEAYRQDVIARAKGDAERFTQVLDAYRTGKDVTRDRMYIETMENVLSNANRMVIDQGGTGGLMPYLSLDNIKRAPSTPAPNTPR